MGHAGITEAVIRQVDEALTAHELIKVKLSKESPITLGEAASQISEQTRCTVVQQIGGGGGWLYFAVTPRNQRSAYR